jgi:hypothetical protein
MQLPQCTNVQHCDPPARNILQDHSTSAQSRTIMCCDLAVTHHLVPQSCTPNSPGDEAGQKAQESGPDSWQFWNKQNEAGQKVDGGSSGPDSWQFWKPSRAMLATGVPCALVCACVSRLAQCALTCFAWCGVAQHALTNVQFCLHAFCTAIYALSQYRHVAPHAESVPELTSRFMSPLILTPPHVVQAPWIALHPRVSTRPVRQSTVVVTGDPIHGSSGDPRGSSSTTAMRLARRHRNPWLALHPRVSTRLVRQSTVVVTGDPTHGSSGDPRGSSSTTAMRLARRHRSLAPTHGSSGTSRMRPASTSTVVATLALTHGSSGDPTGSS